MLVGTVVGSVVSTRKSEKLIGNKFMVVELADRMGKGESQIVAIDNIPPSACWPAAPDW